MAQTELGADALSQGERRERPHVSLVIPVYNEEGTIREVVRRSSDALDQDGRPWEIVFVDDGSKDGTWAALEEIRRDEPNACARCGSSGTSASTPRCTPASSARGAT